MSEKEPNKINYFKEGLKLIPPSLAIAALIWLCSYGYQQTNIKHDEAIKIEQSILEKKGLLGEHQLISLNAVPDLNVSNTQGYFDYFSIRHERDYVEMVRFAWENNGIVQVSEMPIKKVKAIKGDKDLQVLFNINPEDCLVKNSRTKPIISDNINDYVSNSKTVVFSLPEQDYFNFKGAKIE
jgi:hypothetical protein